jgi:hypothetical protein
MKRFKKEDDLAEVAELVRACGGDTRNLPVAFGASGWVTAEQLRTWADIPDVILLASDDELRYPPKPSGKLKPHANVLLVSGSSFSYLLGMGNRETRWPPAGPLAQTQEQGMPRNTLKALVIEALAEAWGVSVEAVVHAAAFSGRDKDKQLTIGKRNNQIAKAEVDVIRKPKK